MKYLSFIFLCIFWVGGQTHAMQRDANDIAPERQHKVQIYIPLKRDILREVRVEFHEGQSNVVQRTFQVLPAVMEGLNVPLDACTRLKISFGTLDAVDTLEILYLHLQQFTSLQNLCLQVQRAPADVVRDLMVQAGVLAYNTGTGEEGVHEAMRLGLSAADIQALGRQGRADEEEQVFAPTLNVRSNTPLNWIPPINNFLAGIYIQMLHIYA